MGKRSPSPPPAPDPAQTAAAQAAANRDAAIAGQELSLIDQTTPTGGVTYEQIGTTEEGNPRYGATITLSEDQQRLLDLQEQLGAQYGETANEQLGRLTEALSTPIDYSGLGPAPTPDAAFRDEIAASMLERQQPRLNDRRAALEAQLSNQGVMPGSEPWRARMRELDAAENDLGLGIDAAAGSEMARQYGLEQAGRNAAINEIIQQRSIPLNELAAMMSGTQVQGPSFVATPQAQVAPADIMGATYGSANLAQQNYATQLANDRLQTQGLYGLLGAGVGGLASNYGGDLGWTFSDRRLKHVIEPVAVHARGFLLYLFQYVWGGPVVIGPMADEVKRIAPDLVAVHPDGWLMVDYGRL